MKPLTQPAPWNHRPLSILSLAILASLLCGCATSPQSAAFDPEAALGEWRTREIRSDSGMLESRGYYEWTVVSRNNVLEIKDGIQWVETKSAPASAGLSALIAFGTMISPPPAPWPRKQTWDGANRLLHFAEISPEGKSYHKIIRFQSPVRAQLTVKNPDEGTISYTARKIQ